MSSDEHIDQMATEDSSLSPLSLQPYGGFMIPSCAPYPSPLIVNSYINISLTDIINAFNTATLGDPLEMYKNIISLHLSKSSETDAELFLNELKVTQSNLNSSSANLKWLADLYNMVIAISLLKILPDEAKQSLISQSSTFWNDCISHLPHNPLETTSD